MTPTVVYVWHQKLHDIIIELCLNVKHVEERISELVEVKNLNNRTCTLEAFYNHVVDGDTGIATLAVVR